MPLTHMTYAAQLHPLDPRPSHRCRGDGERVVETAPQRVSEESCSALVRFDGGAFATVVAGYVGAPGLPDTPVRFVCARGSAVPDAEAGALTLYRGGEPEVLSFPRQPSPQVRQAAAFLDAIERRTGQRNHRKTRCGTSGWPRPSPRPRASGDTSSS